MTRLVLAASVLALACAANGPASALTMSECSTKYQAAKSAGTLGDVKWNDFRKTQCGAEAQPAAATTTAPAQDAKPTPATTPPANTSPTPAASGAAVFPKAVDPKYANESAGKARQKTCLDQYNANKAGGANGNGGLNWIMKGGGYYSECNKRLKV